MYSKTDILMIALCFLCTAIGVFFGIKGKPNWWIVAFFSFGFVFLLVQPFLLKLKSEKKLERVSFDDKELRRIVGGKIKKKIRWDNLNEISIQTTDEGPYNVDIFWLFIEKDRKTVCTIPNNAKDFSDLLNHIQSFPGFNNELVLQAMSSVSNANFKVWSSSSKPNKNV